MNLDLDSRDRNPPGEKASAAASRSAPNGAVALPEDALIILPVRKMVLFPGMILPIALGREASIAAAQAAAKAKRPVGVLLQRNPETEKPEPDELSLVGTVANIVRYVTTPDGTHHVICQGQQRFRVVEYLEGYPFMVARIGRIEELEAAGNEIEARFDLVAGGLEFFDAPDARHHERVALEILDHAEALLPLANDVMRAVGRSNVAHDVGDRADEGKLVRLGLLGFRVPLQEDADRALRLRRCLSGGDRGFAAERDRQDHAGEEHHLAHG